MVFEYWHAVVIVALVALLVWGLIVTRRKTLLGVAAVLLAISGFALYTLVLEEEDLSRDLNGQLDTAAFIGIPAVIGLGILLTIMRAGSRRG